MLTRTAEGYVTNIALLMPFTLTNSAGNVITNAVLDKLTANTFIYKTPDGIMGMMRLDTLPPEMLERIGYDPVAAAKADEADAIKKSLDQQNQLAARQAAQQAALWNGALKTALSKQREFYGDVIQKIDAGLLVRSPGRIEEDVDITQSTILLKRYSGYDSVAAEDQIHVNAFPIGLYSYTTVNKSENTVHVWTCDTNEAMQYYLTH